MKTNFNLKQDIYSFLEVKHMSIERFAEESEISQRNLFYAFKNPSKNVLEKAYSFMYSKGAQLAFIKSEILEESVNNNNLILYHASKEGIENITYDGSRSDSDFGKGFYLTANFASSRAFIENYTHSSIYSFSFSLTGLNVISFECDIDWMLAICYFRGKLKEYVNHPRIKKIIEKINSADIIIAPIADNKMYEVMNSFFNNEITTTVAMHSLAASRLGKQFVIKTQKALGNLKFKYRFYMCKEERKDSENISKNRAKQIQEKLDYVKVEYKGEGEYFKEVLK